MGDVEEVKPEKIQVMSCDAGLLGSSESEESACNAGAWGSTPGSGRQGRQRKRWLDGIADSTDMRASTLWETEDRAGWRAVVHGAAESDTTE